LDVPVGLGAVAVVPNDAAAGHAPGRSRVSTSTARAALPDEVPIADAVFNIAHGALLMLGLSCGDWELVARGLRDRLHQDRRGSLYPKSYELIARVTELGALGATISGAGPTVLVWCLDGAADSVAEELRGEVESWANVTRVAFEPDGAQVHELAGPER
jgi:homoserine kinase